MGGKITSISKELPSESKFYGDKMIHDLMRDHMRIGKDKTCV